MSEPISTIRMMEGGRFGAEKLLFVFDTEFFRKDDGMLDQELFEKIITTLEDNGLEIEKSGGRVVVDPRLDQQDITAIRVSALSFLENLEEKIRPNIGDTLVSNALLNATEEGLVSGLLDDIKLEKQQAVGVGLWSAADMAMMPVQATSMITMFAGSAAISAGTITLPFNMKLGVELILSGIAAMVGGGASAAATVAISDRIEGKLEGAKEERDETRESIAEKREAMNRHFEGNELDL